jgi:MoxR-like ATPase
MAKKNLADWLKSATTLEKQINEVILGQENPIRLILISIFARGHVLLEGDVGVGKLQCCVLLLEVLGVAMRGLRGLLT